MREVSYVEANGIRIAYETFGEEQSPPIVLVAGLAVQMLAWPDELCDQLAARGFYVVRADNRDAGLSTHLSAARALRLIDIARRRGPYAIEDMAQDVVGLIDALELAPVHLVGASMGGFIAQTVAIKSPDLVRTLSLIMTSTGSRRVGRPRRDVAWRIARRSPAAGRDEAIAAAVETFQLIGSPGYPFDEAMIRDIAGRSFDRDDDSTGRLRQLAAVVAQPNRTRDLRKLAISTLVLHGLADPVIAPSGGVALAKAIPGARFVGFSGMAHDLPRQLWSSVIDEIAALAGAK